MYKVNDKVIYKRDVCVVKEIKTIHEEKYYVLESKIDPTLLIQIPVEKESLFIRRLITKEGVSALIEKIPTIKTLPIEARNLEEDYKRIIQDTTLDGLIAVIKTAYLRNKIREEEGRKIGQVDQFYFELSERYLYTEIAYALEISYEEAKEYVLKALSKID